MSYILDALKKSEAERNRGVAPSLLAIRHVQLRSRAGLWALLAALLVNACLGGYWLYSRSEAVTPEAIVTTTPAPTARPEVIPAPVVDEPGSAAPDQTPASLARPTTIGPTPTTSTPDEVQRPAVRPRQTTNEMELANLAFSTHVYASDPTKRAVTLNGRRLVEGDSISRGVVLKEITETGVILDVNGREVSLEVLQDWH